MTVHNDDVELSIENPTEERLDQYLAAQVPDLSRSRIQALIKSGHILINGQKTKPRNQLKAGDTVSIDIPPPESSELIAQDIPLDVIFEDDSLIVLNKAAGMVVHPAAGNPDGTLVNALLHHCQGQLGGIGGIERPGIVHRLDKDTSGCIIAAKTDEALQSLLDQFATRTTSKYYLAITETRPRQSDALVTTYIGRHPVQRQKMANLAQGQGREATTHYRILHEDPQSGTCLVLCQLFTGRTHQIRLHMKHEGAALLGDPIYAKPERQSLKLPTPESPNRLGLHAWHLAVDHPITQERLFFHAPIPKAFSPLSAAVEDTLHSIKKSQLSSSE